MLPKVILMPLPLTVLLLLQLSLPVNVLLLSTLRSSNSLVACVFVASLCLRRRRNQRSQTTSRIRKTTDVAEPAAMCDTKSSESEDSSRSDSSMTSIACSSGERVKTGTKGGPSSVLRLSSFMAKTRSQTSAGVGIVSMRACHERGIDCNFFAFLLGLLFLLLSCHHPQLTIW